MNCDTHNLGGGPARNLCVHLTRQRHHFHKRAPTYSASLLEGSSTVFIMGKFGSTDFQARSIGSRPLTFLLVVALVHLRIWSDEAESFSLTAARYHTTMGYLGSNISVDRVPPASLIVGASVTSTCQVCSGAEKRYYVRTLTMAHVRPEVRGTDIPLIPPGGPRVGQMIGHLVRNLMPMHCRSSNSVTMFKLH